MDYEKIQDENFLKSLQPTAIFEIENFEAIKYRACDYIDGLDWDYAASFSYILEEKLKQASARNQQEQYIWRVLLFWTLKLRLFAFNNLSSQEQADLLKTNLITMLAYGLDVKKYIVDYFGTYGSIKSVENGVGNLMPALYNSNEQLGLNIEAFNKNGFRPTVANWLREYQTILKSEKTGVSGEASAFHILKFLDTNVNARLLTAQEKDVMRSLLDFYNWLLNPITYSSNDVEDNSQPYTNTQQFTLPKEMIEPETPSQQLPIAKLPPVVPTPKNAPAVKPMGDVDTGIRKQELGIRNTASNGQAGVKLSPVMPPVSQIMNQPLARPAPQRTDVVNGYRPQPSKSIHDILQERDSQDGVGLKTSDSNKTAQPEKNKFSISDKNTSSLSSATPSAQKFVKVDAVKQAEIDRKLQELEKKIEQN